MSSLSFLWVFYFFLLFIIMELVSPPSEFIVYPSDLSFDGVLTLLKLLIYRVSNAIESWPSIDWENPLLVRILSKKSLTCARFQCAEIYFRYRVLSIRLFILASSNFTGGSILVEEFCLM